MRNYEITGLIKLQGLIYNLSLINNDDEKLILNIKINIIVNGNLNPGNSYLLENCTKSDASGNA